MENIVICSIRATKNRPVTKEHFDLFGSYGSAEGRYRFADGRTLDVIGSFKKALEDHRHSDSPKHRFIAGGNNQYSGQGHLEILAFEMESGIQIRHVD